VKQWKAFVSKTTLLARTTMLDEVVTFIAMFVLPPLEAARDAQAFEAIWKPAGPWAVSAFF
jgi:hypothetical protein